MTRRSLSKREADRVLALEWEKKPIISLHDIKRRLRCSEAYARYIAHALRKKGWLEPLGQGHYQLIGAVRGPKGIPEMNPYRIVRFFPKPYFLAYRFACEHHGLTTQVPTVISVAVLRPKRPVELKNIRFDPAQFLRQLRSADYDWEDLRQLVRRNEKISPEQLISVCESRYRFLLALTMNEERLIADAKRHKLPDLPAKLLQEAKR